MEQLSGSRAQGGEARAPGARGSGYVLLVGFGKSGSKRLLQILDLSPRTHCRCEANVLEGSPFGALPPCRILLPDTGEAMEKHWDRAIAWAWQRMGERDRLPLPPKDHLYGFVRPAQLYRVLKHGRLRRMLGTVVQEWRHSEWLLPRWMGSRERLRRATLVLKTGAVPGWVPWVLRNRPEARVVDLVRHPAGVLHSFAGRFLPHLNDPQAALMLNRTRLQEITRADPRWSRRFGCIDAMGLKELELWYWVYSNEVTQEAGRRSPAYTLIKDEDVIADPIAAARGMYESCGLEWTRNVEEYLLKMRPHWQERTAPWRDLLEASDVELVERILSATEMRDWWRPDQAVSLYDYEAYTRPTGRARGYDAILK